MMKRWACMVLALSLMMIGGCTSEKVDNNKKEGLTIVTSFYPMYVVTLNIARDIPNVKVVNMTQPQTGCLHDYQLKPEDVKTLEQADAFVVNGAGMEAFLEDVVKEQKNLTIIEASRGIELIKDASGVENPHVWVSISSHIQQVRNITDQLAIWDPPHATAYELNADVYIAKLEALQVSMKESLSKVTKHDIITFHEAFPYFAREFGLNLVAVIEREPGTSPTPQELEDTIELVKDTDIQALFAEPQYSPGAAQTISDETGATVYILDPIVTGIAGTQSYDDYLVRMQSNLEVLEKALN